MLVRELIASLGLEIDEASFARGEQAVEALHHSFKAFAVGAGVAVAGALVYFTKETSEAADAAGKLSASTGLNSEFLQKLGYAADLADVSMEQLTVGLRHLAKSGVKDLQGSILGIADQFQKMPNDGAKVALAMEKFGRSGAALIPLLNGGSESIRELMKEAEDLGLVFSEEDSKAAEEFNDDTKRLTKSLTGLRNDIGRVLIPVLHKLVNGMRDFMKTMRALMPSFHNFAIILKVGIVTAVAAVTAALLMNAAAAATATSWYVALGIASARAGIAAAWAWAKAAAPMVALTALIAFVLIGLQDIYYFFTGRKSLIGALLPDLEKFLNVFTQVSPGDPWWLKALKDTLYVMKEIIPMLTDLQGTFQKFGRAAQADFVSGLKVVQNNGQYTQGPDGKYYPNAPSVPASGGGNSTTLSVNAPITVNATTGASAKEIGDHVSRAVTEGINSWWAPTPAGVE